MEDVNEMSKKTQVSRETETGDGRPDTGRISGKILIFAK